MKKVVQKNYNYLAVHLLFIIKKKYSCKKIVNSNTKNKRKRDEVKDNGKKLKKN